MRQEEGGTPQSIERRFRAVNDTASPNLVHDDEFARRLGFRGGLVPGVDLYAFMAELPAEVWGEAWSRVGSMSARFSRPVYDGDEVRVRAVGSESADGPRLELELRNASDEVCATGSASTSPGGPPPSEATYPSAPLPGDPPPPASLMEGQPLGTLEGRLELRDHAWPARLGNEILMANCALPPWMHVESRVRHLGLPAAGEAVIVRGSVAGVWEHKGHRFVDLDLLIVAANGGGLAHLHHVAIVELAQQRQA